MTKNENGTQVPVLPTNHRINTHYGMSSCSEVNDDPLAIIHLYLTSMDPHGSPPTLSTNHSIHIFTQMISFVSNSNLTLGPSQKRPTINRRWLVWSNGCGMLRSPVSSSLLLPIARRIEVTCSLVTVTTEDPRARWQMKSQR